MESSGAAVGAPGDSVGEVVTMDNSTVRGLVIEVRDRLLRGCHVYANPADLSRSQFRITGLRQRGGVLQARALGDGKWYEVLPELEDKSSIPIKLGFRAGGSR